MANIAFAGTPIFAATILKALLQQGYQFSCCLTQPDRPKGRGQKIQFSPVKEVALAHHIPVLQPETLKENVIQNILQEYNLDLLIVVAYGLLLPQTVLDIPTHGCLNVHASLLPAFRGAAPIQRAILAGGATTGVALMKMEAGLDTGPVYTSYVCPILDADTTITLHDKLALLGAKALIETLPSIISGKLAPKAQNNSKASYAEKIKKAEAKIDWQKSAHALAREIRAYQPWPVSYFDWQGQAIKVFQATAMIEKKAHAPGTLLDVSKDGLDVATSNGILRIKKLQLPGKKPVGMQDFLNSKPNFFIPNTQL